MLTRILFPAILSVCMLLSACHSSELKKNEPLPPAPSAGGDFSALETNLAHDTGNTELRLLLASKYYAAGDLDRATDLYYQVYKKDNTIQTALINLGNIAYDRHQDDKAIAYYEKALETDSLNLDVRCDLATCYANVSKLNKAIEILRFNIRTDPNHIKSHYNLSVILQKKGELKEAEDELKIYNTLLADKK
ncbi:MAG: tetratricopeptide repeat protein [Bacteroidia bacterium]